jgi:hypothetical protein
MGEVIFHDFADLDRRQRELELHEARELAREFPDLTNAAPNMVQLLARLQGLFYLHRDTIPAAFDHAIEATSALLDWLDERTPT